MNPERPRNPFIIYWDLHPHGYSTETVLRICNELVEAGIFVLNLTDVSYPLSKATINILKRLNNDPIRIHLTVDKRALEELMNLVNETGAAKLHIQIDTLKQLQDSLYEIKRMIQEGCLAGLSFKINNNNVREMPKILSLCIMNQIKEITFPIQRTGQVKISCLDSETLIRFSDELKKMETEKLNLNIHDPFLWKVFYRKENPNEDGCNGAKTMMFISEDLEVTPCPIFPVSIGNLRELSLMEICSSSKRYQVIDSLAVLPLECKACNIIDKCRGGCRGRTYSFFRDYDKKDPACFPFTY